MVYILMSCGTELQKHGKGRSISTNDHNKYPNHRECVEIGRYTFQKKNGEVGLIGDAQ